MCVYLVCTFFDSSEKEEESAATTPYTPPFQGPWANFIRDEEEGDSSEEENSEDDDPDEPVAKAGGQGLVEVAKWESICRSSTSM